MLRLLVVLLGWPAAAPGWGQPPTASRARRDSLHRVLEQEPPFLRMAYAHNGQSLPAAVPFILYAWDRHEPVAVRHVPGRGYLLPPGAGDSLAVGVGMGGHVQWYGPVPARYFVHGASVTFGYLDRAHLQQLPATGEAGRVLSQALEHQPWRRAPGLQGVRYRIIRPRVIGDSMVFVTTVPVF